MMHFWKVVCASGNKREGEHYLDPEMVQAIEPVDAQSCHIRMVSGWVYLVKRPAASVAREREEL